VGPTRTGVCHDPAVAHERLPSHDVPLLDGLRAVAAVLVLTTHVGFQTGFTFTGSWPGAAVARFDLGVPLFFALSGFLLVRPWLGAAVAGRPEPSVRRYLSRRAARILPAYWVVLVVALLTTAAGAGLVSVVAHWALLQVYLGVPLLGLTQTWSLSTEVAFYLLLPLVAAPIAGRSLTERGRRVLAWWLAAAVALAWIWTGLAAAGTLPRRSSTWLPGHLDWFAVGLALAVAESHVRIRPGGRTARVATDVGRHPGTALLLAGAAFWLVCTPLGGPATLATPPPATAVVKEGLYAVIAGLLLLAAGAVDQRRGWVAGALGNRAVQALGRVSYGVFLWHLLVLAGVLAVLGRQPFTGGFWPVLLLTLLGTVAVSAVSWTVLEQPVLRRVHRLPLTRRGTAAPPVPVAAATTATTVTRATMATEPGGPTPPEPPAPR